MLTTKIQRRFPFPCRTFGWAIAGALLLGGATDSFAAPSKSFVVTAEQPDFKIDDVSAELRTPQTKAVKAKVAPGPRRTRRPRRFAAQPGPLKVEIKTHKGNSFLFVKVRRNGQNMVVRVPLHDHHGHEEKKPKRVIAKAMKARRGSAPVRSSAARGPKEITAKPDPTPHPLDVGPLCVSYWESGNPVDDCRLPTN